MPSRKDMMRFAQGSDEAAASGRPRGLRRSRPRPKLRALTNPAPDRQAGPWFGTVPRRSPSA